MSETVAGFHAMKEMQKYDADRRRSLNANLFNDARSLASKSGLRLIRCDDVHYQIEHPSGWLINVYPGNQRIFADRQRKIRAPYLVVDAEEWIR